MFTIGGSTGIILSSNVMDISILVNDLETLKYQIIMK
jgi:hypothetical protein